MCRLALFRGMEDEVQLCFALSELELSMGGHGNGIYSEESGCKKSVNLACTDIASGIAKTSLTEPVLFHTRLASAGGITDRLCHPFEVEGEAGKFVVAHNGHWSDWGYFSDYEEESDTEVAARLIAQYGPGVLLSDVFDYGGVYIVADITNSMVWADWFIVRRSGNFYINRLQTSKDAPHRYFHSSEPVRAFDGEYVSSAPIPVDIMFRVRPNGKIKQAKWIDPVEPEKARSWDAHRTYHYSSGGVYMASSSSAGSNERKSYFYSEEDDAWVGVNGPESFDADAAEDTFQCMSVACDGRTTYWHCDACLIKDLDEAILAEGVELTDEEYAERLSLAFEWENEQKLIEEYSYRRSREAVLEAERVEICDMGMGVPDYEPEAGTLALEAARKLYSVPDMSDEDAAFLSSIDR